MATSRLDSVFQQLRRVTLMRDGAGLTDAQLLELFNVQQDQAAFEAIVRRLGPMVLKVCRRVVGNQHDAEDVFQATFLLLARKAASLKSRDRVANWLHGVAYRTALKARKLRSKHQARERQIVSIPEPEAVQQEDRHTLQPLLDQELSRLAEIYRLPILLCDLEGKSIKKVAQQLGWPQGTVAGRLARGRKLLAKRLARHGLAVTGGVVLIQNSASACVSPSLTAATVKAAGAYAAGKSAAAGVVSANVAKLMEAVIKAMFLTKMKFAMVVLVVGTIIALGGGVGIHISATGPQEGTLKIEKEGKIGVAEPYPTAVIEEVEAPKKDSARTTPNVPPTKEQILDYLNNNARRVTSLGFADMSLTVIQGRKSFGLRASMVTEKPRNFRLGAYTLGNPAIDLGSNYQEFWYRIGDPDTAAQVYCSYKDLHEGRVRRLTFPVHPEWVMESMGLGTYGPPEKYAREYDADTIKLVEKPMSLQGTSVRKVIVLKRAAVMVPNPQVTDYLLLDDASGQEICSAHIGETQLDRYTGAVLPRRMKFRWKVANESITLVLRFDGMAVNPKSARATFIRQTPVGVRADDLATDVSDQDK